ncbi:MAG: hypothetical protein ABJA85_04875 [Bacteroidota bacterium]
MSKFFAAIIVSSCFLLFNSVSAKAQQTDSVSAEDVKEEPPADEQPGKVWFLKKQDYEGDSFAVQQRKIPDSLVKKMQEDDNFWYANAVIEKKKKQEEENNEDAYTPVSKRSWFQTLIWLIIIGGFAAFLMIYLTGNDIGLFRKKNNVSNLVEEEVATEDIFAINYQKEIDKAALQGNYRLAIRLMFLRLLKNLSEKNIIRYQQDKTNFDYLGQLHSTKYYNNFFRITRNYEYSWYGKFEVSEDAYRIIRKDFDHFESALR